VLWGNPSTQSTIEDARKYIFDRVNDFVLYENNNKCKSIKNIIHYQLFIQTKDINLLNILEGI
jgi:hypothetical protein